jgi:uncharacterized protein
MNNFTQVLGVVTGWLLIGWVGVQGASFGLGAVRRHFSRRRRYEAERTAFCQRIQSTAQAARATKAIPDWNGWRAFRISAIVDESQDVKSFYFTPVDGRPLSPFAPGQYLTFRLPVPGSDGPLVRCYSLSDRPRQDYYRSTIKRVGRASSFFHDCVHVGDVLEVRAPAGTFFIDPHDDAPLVLIGAGIGVTPLVSMMESIVHAGQAREVHVLFGFRNRREHPFQERVATLVRENPQLRLHVSYSGPQQRDVLYRDYNHRGRLAIERLQAVLPSNNFEFYVCGPSGLMESLVPALWHWGVPESHVHFEAFGPASVKRICASEATAAVQQSCEVRFARSGRTVAWDGSFASLLEFGEAAGVAMPSGCRAGSCGECMTGVQSGAIATRKQSGVHVPAGQCLTCISVPAEGLVLDA